VKRRKAQLFQMLSSRFYSPRFVFVFAIALIVGLRAWFFLFLTGFTGYAGYFYLS
jgi:hypothetical protein